jgi:hypothetical protein
LRAQCADEVCGVLSEYWHAAASQHAFRARKPLQSCIKKYALKLTGLTLVTGWWGMISAVINPFLIINNLFRYFASLGMADGGEVVAGPMVTTQTGRPIVVGSSPPSAPPSGLSAYRQDIVLRLRGGQTPAQIAAYVAPLAGVPAATVQAYAEALQDG